MTISPGMITWDTDDAPRLARWWADATAGRIVQDYEGSFVVVLLPSGLRFAFQEVDDPTPGKNRVHVDFEVEDLDPAVEALRAAGAGHVADREMPGFRWVTLSDPDGNQFCVSGPAEHVL